MEAALEQYVERVDSTPCMGTSISLHRGTSDHVLLDRRSRVLVFLKGSAREKAELRKRDPREYEYFENVWKVRQNHMDHTLPSNYIFLLRCCGKGSCPHPLCKTRNTERERPLTANQVAVKDASKEIFCICRQREGTRFMICCDQCGEWFHVDCIGITEEGNRMAKDDEPYICHQCEHPVHHEPQVDLLVPKWHPGGPSFDFFPYQPVMLQGLGGVIVTAVAATALVIKWQTSTSC